MCCENDAISHFVLLLVYMIRFGFRWYERKQVENQWARDSVLAVTEIFLVAFLKRRSVPK